MEAELAQIFQKQHDYKVCSNCNALNWHENEGCFECGKKRFSIKKVKNHIKEEYDYYLDVEKYSEKEIDAVKLRVS